MGAESFEKLPNGDLTSGAFEYGQLSAEPGNVEIFNKARTGSKSLRIKGGAGRSVTMKVWEEAEIECENCRTKAQIARQHEAPSWNGIVDSREWKASEAFTEPPSPACGGTGN